MTRTHNRKFAEPAAYKTPERRALMIAAFVKPNQILPLLNALPGEPVPNVKACGNWAMELKRTGELVPKKAARIVNPPKPRPSRAKVRAFVAVPAPIPIAVTPAPVETVETDFPCERVIFANWGNIVQMAARDMYPLYGLADIQAYNRYREKRGVPMVFLKNWGRHAR